MVAQVEWRCSGSAGLLERRRWGCGGVGGADRVAMLDGKGGGAREEEMGTMWSWWRRSSGDARDASTPFVFITFSTAMRPSDENLLNKYAVKSTILASTSGNDDATCSATGSIIFDNAEAINAASPATRGGVATRRGAATRG